MLYVGLGTVLSPVILTCWLNFLEDPRTIHSLTSSPASYCFWLNFLDGPWTQLVISPCLMVTGQLMEQAVTNLPCSGTVGLCPGQWSPCPCLCGGHPWLLVCLPSWSCPIFAAPWWKILAEIFQMYLSLFVTCAIWLIGSILKKKKVFFLLGLLNINIFSLGSNKKKP